MNWGKTVPSSVTLTLNLETADGAKTDSVTINDLVIAGWTGRNAEAIEEHIKELEAIGVPRPSVVPCFYRASAKLLTTEDTIEALGDESSGEVEFVLYGSADGMMVGVGSDHTDRKIEAYSVPVSKQMCFKPVSPTVWRYADVVDHWDEVKLRSWAVNGEERRLYQEGTVAAMRPPEDLIGRYLDGAAELPPGMAMFCGTLAVHGGVEAAERFEVELEDPVLKRSIRYGYSVTSLPVVE